MFNAQVVPNFISEETCLLLINSVKDTELWFPVPNSTWDRRSIHIESLYKDVNREVFDIVKDATLRVKALIEEKFTLDKEVYPDIASINRWFPGMSQDPHADDMTNTPIKGFESRVFGSIIYLNTEYEGGHTYYPDYGIEIIPEIGKLAVHPGGIDHIHGVTEVKNGMRYTISSFWNYEKERGIDWSLYP